MGGERIKNGFIKPEQTCDVGPYLRNRSGPADSVLCPFQSVLCLLLPCSYARSSCFPGPRAQERELIFFSSHSRSVPVPNQFPFQMGPSLQQTIFSISHCGCHEGLIPQDAFTLVSKYMSITSMMTKKDTKYQPTFGHGIDGLFLPLELNFRHIKMQIRHKGD